MLLKACGKRAHKPFATEHSWRQTEALCFQAVHVKPCISEEDGGVETNHVLSDPLLCFIHGLLVKLGPVFFFCMSCSVLLPQLLLSVYLKLV